jgi:hypothetical protein
LLVRVNYEIEIVRRTLPPRHPRRRRRKQEHTDEQTNGLDVRLILVAER